MIQARLRQAVQASLRPAQFAVIVLGLALGMPASFAENPRPNIVIIMADDMGFSDLGCYGGEIRTPNLDQLAAEGLRYTNFYNAAKCHTTRACLMSGIYPHRTGCEIPLTSRDQETKAKPQHSGVSIASVLKTAGYATIASGKWHAGGKPLERGFDHFFGLPGGACSFFTPSKPLTKDGRSFKPGPDEEFYFTDAISDQAIGYLDQHFAKQDKKPFFLYLAYAAPHWPIQALEEDIERYRGRYAGGWEAVRESRIQRLKGLGIIAKDWQLPSMEPSPSWQSEEHPEWQQRRMEVFAAMIDRMDQAIGRVLDSIRKRDTLDNTVVFFLSDNGGSQEEISGKFDWVRSVMPDVTRDGSRIIAGNDPSVMPGPENTFQSVGHHWGNTSNTPFRYGKVRTHEGGIATPLIVHWPAGIRKQGALRRQLGHVVDLLPTCIELAGAAYPTKHKNRPTESLDGVSLLPTFDDRPLDERSLFFEMNGNRAIRTEQWKAVSRQGLSGKVRKQVRLSIAEWELYDMRNDRTETRNLAAEHPELLKTMVAQWEAWMLGPN